MHYNSKLQRFDWPLKLHIHPIDFTVAFASSGWCVLVCCFPTAIRTFDLTLNVVNSGRAMDNWKFLEMLRKVHCHLFRLTEFLSNATVEITAFLTFDSTLLCPVRSYDKSMEIATCKYSQDVSDAIFAHSLVNIQCSCPMSIMQMWSRRTAFDCVKFSKSTFRIHCIDS